MKMKETDLAQPIVNWLIDQHWDVFQEVQFYYGGHVADIVAVRNGIVWIIEVKTSLSIEVLNQASSWASHYRSVAVPVALHDNHRDYNVAKYYYRVGVLEVSDGFIDERLEPPLFTKHHANAKQMIAKLNKLHKSYAVAGSRSGSHLTP